MNMLTFLRRLRFLSVRQRLEWFPPFFLMRVKVLELTDDWQTVRLHLPLNAFSRNMSNSMFGGYQAALADPIAALACAHRYPGHEVWTRAMHIDFVAEGNSNLELRFEFDAAIDQHIRDDLAARGRSTPQFEYGFYRQDDVLCSRIINTVAIRPKGYAAPSAIIGNEKRGSLEE